MSVLKKSIFISLLFLLGSCTVNQQNVELWSLKQVRDGRITLYDINNDKVQDLIVSGYQKGGKTDMKKTLFVENDLKAIETDTGKWEGRGYSFYLDREYKLWVRIKGKAQPVKGNYISNISAVLTEDNKLEVLHNNKKQNTPDNTWEIPGVKLWVDKNNRLWIDENGEKTISKNGRWKRKLNVLVNPLGEFIKGTGYKRGGKIDDERIPIGDSVIAIDGKTQKILWSYQTYGSVTTYPSIADDKVFFGSHDKNMYALNLKTGRLVWRFPTFSQINSTASIYKNKIFFGNSAGYFYALDARNGNLVWRYRTKGGIDSSPAIHDDKVFFGTWDKGVYALNTNNGRLLWKQELLSYIGQSSPLIYNDKVILGSWDKNVYAFNVTNGRTEWIVETDDWIDKASPAAGNGLIYIGNKSGKVYAISPETGDIKWEFAASDAIASTPAITKNRVYVTSRDGYLYALSSKKGEKVWEFRTRFKIYGSPAVAENKVYFSSMGGYLKAVIDTYMGRPSWAMAGGDPTHRNNISPAVSYSRKLVASKTELDKFLEKNNIRKLD